MVKGFEKIVRRHRKGMREWHTRAGFTLIELLIVVAIISILAAIAVPNFLEAQTRSKVARIKNDARVLATALEAYRVDTNRYPPRLKGPDSGFLGTGNVTVRIQDMSLLTTPISYITSVPIDVFENRFQENRVIDYMSPAIVEHLRDVVGARASTFIYSEEKLTNNTYDYGYGLVSVGPDGRYGFTTPNAGALGEQEAFSHWQTDYDPTNGTVSPGNIYRFQRSGASALDAFSRR